MIVAMFLSKLKEKLAYIQQTIQNKLEIWGNGNKLNLCTYNFITHCTVNTVNIFAKMSNASFNLKNICETVSPRGGGLPVPVALPTVLATLWPSSAHTCYCPLDAGCACMCALALFFSALLQYVWKELTALRGWMGVVTGLCQQILHTDMRDTWRSLQLCNTVKLHYSAYCAATVC